MNVISKAEMKNVKGGDGETVGHLGEHARMFCRSFYVALIGEPIEVDDCSVSRWATYCADRMGYSEADSQCIFYGGL